MKADFDDLCATGAVAGPCNEEQIKEAERVLGISFPKQYRSFLSKYGAVVAEGFELFGLPATVGDEPPLWQDVVNVRNQLVEWRQDGSEFPSYVPISEDGTGIYFFLDAGAAPDTKILAVGAGIRKVVSSDLFEFAVNLSRGTTGL